MQFGAGQYSFGAVSCRHAQGSILWRQLPTKMYGVKSCRTVSFIFASFFVTLSFISFCFVFIYFLYPRFSVLSRSYLSFLLFFLFQIFTQSLFLSSLSHHSKWCQFLSVPLFLPHSQYNLHNSQTSVTVKQPSCVQNRELASSRVTWLANLAIRSRSAS